MGFDIKMICASNQKINYDLVEPLLIKGNNKRKERVKINFDCFIEYYFSILLTK